MPKIRSDVPSSLFMQGLGPVHSGIADMRTDMTRQYAISIKGYKPQTSEPPSLYACRQF
ncbi:MAG: hypothetical protein ABSG91_21690 [Syntrophobacteraceae bacterium]